MQKGLTKILSNFLAKIARSSLLFVKVSLQKKRAIAFEKRSYRP